MSLSKREVAVAKLVAKGLSNRAVGDLLGITEKTVKFHVTNIFRKMRIKSRCELIAMTVEERVKGDVIA